MDLPLKELLLGFLPSNHVVETEKQMLWLEAPIDKNSWRTIFSNQKIFFFFLATLYFFCLGIAYLCFFSMYLLSSWEPSLNLAINISPRTAVPQDE